MISSFFSSLHRLAVPAGWSDASASLRGSFDFLLKVLLSM